MVGLLAVAAVTAAVPVCTGPATPMNRAITSPVVIEQAAEPANTVASLRELYEQGVDFDTFLDDAEARRPLWLENWAEATVPEPLLERARAVPGTWRILAVAVDACSDSVNTIPFIAKLSELVPGIELRIIDSTVGREIMEAHRTPDGRAATPTLLLLNDEWQQAGCWVERPLVLQEWYAEKQKELGQRQLTEQKMAWYKQDAGRATLAEAVAMIEGAAAGDVLCAPRQSANR